MRVDPNGNAWWDWLLGAIGVVFTVAVGIAASVVSFLIASPLVGLGLAALGGAMLGFAGGFTSNVISQVKYAGWDNVDMKQAWKAGGEGFIVGAISGTLSYSFGILAKGIGESFGFALSKMTLGGFEVSKAFSSQLMMGFFGKTLGIIGGLAASFYGDYIGANLFNRTYSINDARNSRDSVIFGWMLEFMTWLLKV